jgi:hypothetical protein
MRCTRKREYYYPYRQKYERRRIVVPGSYYLIQADLLLLDKIGRVHSGYEYILSVINVFCKKANTDPIKKKIGREVVKGLKNIFNVSTEKRNERKKFLQVDERKELFNSNVKLLKIMLSNYFITIWIQKLIFLKGFRGRS